MEASSYPHLQPSYPLLTGTELSIRQFVFSGGFMVCQSNVLYYNIKIKSELQRENEDLELMRF